MQSNQPFEFISVQELTETIKDKSKIPHKDYIVVDVRDLDHNGGNIVNSINVPSVIFLDRVDELLKNHKDTPLIVFHCMQSQIRGPSCARKYIKRKEELGDSSAVKQKVAVLEGGFLAWELYHRSNATTMISNYDKERWAMGYID